MLNVTSIKRVTRPQTMKILTTYILWYISACNLSSVPLPLPNYYNRQTHMPKKWKNSTERIPRGKHRKSHERCTATESADVTNFRLKGAGRLPSSISDILHPLINIWLIGGGAETNARQWTERNSNVAICSNYIKTLWMENEVFINKTDGLQDLQIL